MAPMFVPIKDAVISLGIVLVATGAGQWVLAAAGLRFAGAGERLVFSAALGMGLMSAAVFVLGVFGLLVPAAIWLVLACALLAALIGWRRADPAADRADTAPFSHRADQLCAVLLAAAVAAGFLLVLTPALGKDTLAYHLAVPKLYLANRGFYFIDGNIFSNYPLASEMLYTIALVAGSDVTAKGIHFFSAVILLIGMHRMAADHLNLKSGAMAGLLVFFSLPTVFVTAPMAYSDLTFALFVFLAVYAFLNWTARGQDRWLAFAGVLSGLVLSTKYGGLLVPIVAVLGILWACRSQQFQAARALRLVLLYLACTIAVGCPFYVKNAVLTGNPLYPFFYDIFGGRGWDAVQARQYDLFHQTLGMGRRFADYLMLPWNVSVHARMNSPRFDGFIGPVFVLTAPFAAGMRNLTPGAKVVLVYCLFSFLFWALSVQQLRYLMPIFPFLGLMVAATAAYYRKKTVMYAIVCACIAVGVGINAVENARHIRAIDPLPVATGTQTRDAFYRQHIAAYPMFAYVNTHLPADAKIFMVYMRNMGYLCERTYFSDAILESRTLDRILSASDTARDVHRALKQMGFSHLLYDRRYVLSEHSPLSAENKALFLLYQRQYLEPVKIGGNRFFLFRLTDTAQTPGSAGTKEP